MAEISIGREKNEQIKGLISSKWLFFVSQYNSSLSNFRALRQVVAETEKKITDRQTHRQTDINKHNYRNGNSIYPLCTSNREYNNNNNNNSNNNNNNNNDNNNNNVGFIKVVCAL